MKVEQTRQRLSNGTGDHCVVGATRNASVVAELDALFNEMGSISNPLNFFTTNQPSDEPHRMSSPACAEQRWP